MVADPRPTRGSLFRIYRDTRFSADKRPFNAHVGFHVSHARGKYARRRPERWAKVKRKLELEGDSLMRPLRGFDANHRFIENSERKDFVASVGLTEAQVCGSKLMQDFAAACRKMLPLVEFTTRALGLQPYALPPARARIAASFPPALPGSIWLRQSNFLRTT